MKELIIAAAKHWADFLRDPYSFRFNNGDLSQTGKMCAMMASMGKPGCYPEYEINDFEAALIELITNKLPRSISNDYHADPILQEAAAKAKLTGFSDMNSFPVKYSMYINYAQQQVAVSHSYDKSLAATIFEAECIS